MSTHRIALVVLLAFVACKGGSGSSQDDADDAAADFHLQASSPAVDAGAASEFAATYEALYGESIDVDIERAPRLAGASVDLGAFER